MQKTASRTHVAESIMQGRASRDLLKKDRAARQSLSAPCCGTAATFILSISFRLLTEHRRCPLPLPLENSASEQIREAQNLGKAHNCLQLREFVQRRNFLKAVAV